MRADSRALVRATGLAKTFVLHHQGSAELPVFAGIDLTVAAGECVALSGPSGCGKSTLMRCLYGNYAPTAGVVEVQHLGEWLDLSTAPPRALMAARRSSLGHVSQFLRVIPRVPTLELVAEPLRRIGVCARPGPRAGARAVGAVEAARAPVAAATATFSGGEQQRVNVARGLIAQSAVLLLDEPTASLDAANRQVVVDLIREARDRGAAVVGIFHDHEVRAAVATRVFHIQPHRPTASWPDREH